MVKSGACSGGADWTGESLFRITRWKNLSVITQKRERMRRKEQRRRISRKGLYKQMKFPRKASALTSNITSKSCSRVRFPLNSRRRQSH